MRKISLKEALTLISWPNLFVFTKTNLLASEIATYVHTYKFN